MCYLGYPAWYRVHLDQQRLTEHLRAIQFYRIRRKTTNKVKSIIIMNPDHTSLQMLDIGPPQSDTVLLLAHGAGAPMDSPFMEAIAEGLSERGIRSIRFEFPYMAERRASGKKRPPDRQPVLLDCFREAIRRVAETSPATASLYIGGKSMGGRMATILAAYGDSAPSAAPRLEGVVCLGYPFHPPGKPEKTRIDHFPDIGCPVLICQGDRDPFGTKAEIENYRLPSHVQFCWLPDGNHDLAPRVKSGHSKEQNLAQTIGALEEFMALKNTSAQ